MKTKKRFGLQALVPYICLVMALFSLAGCKDLFHGEGMPNGPPDDPPEDGGSGPVIAALAQPAVGATTISIVVSGSFFNTSTAITDFAIGGAQASAVTALGTVTATQVTFTTTALAAGDVIMIQALATAFNPAASAASNTVTFTATATIPITSITYTVDSIAPTAAGHIWRNGATDIQVFDTALKTYTSGNGNYALMDALLTGLVTGDTVRFTSSNLIDELTHASTTADSTITIGANLTAAHFAPAVSLAGNATKGFAITGSLNPSVLTFGTTAGKSTYNGVEVTPVDGPIVLTPSSAIAITVKTGHASNVVKVASGSTITSLTVDSTSTLPTTGIQVARTGVTVAAAVATTVDASALTTGTVTVAGASTAAVTIDGVAITPASGTDSVVTKTAAAAMTLTSGAAGATVAIVSGTPAVTIEYPLTAITTNGGGSIIVPIAASGVAITATAATTVDISGLTTAGNTVLLSGNFAFALTTITGGSAYADVSGTVTGGTKVYNYAATPGSAAFSAGTITGFTLTNSGGATTTVTVTTP
ncbi:hypothetical protein AGMMS49940_05420 [Spirochaetia bacterium]|nr:hypothetical protein AGMMS49940_05420 [Spirochaetia bacterium]